MTTTIHLSGPTHMLAVLPYQLGFHPSDSLVAVSMQGSRMGLVQRIDLPPPEHVDQAVAAMVVPLLRDNPQAVLLIGFEERESASLPMLDAMAVACRAKGVEVADRMVVRGGRWFAPDCRRTCCPTEGLPVPAPSEVPAVAEFVGREICPLPDRSALADRLEPCNPMLNRAVSVLAGEWVALRPKADSAVQDSDPGECEAEGLGISGASELDIARASELAVWSRVLCEEDDAESIHAFSSYDLAKLAGSLTDVDLRDTLIAMLCPGTLPQQMVDKRLWAQMSQILPAAPWRQSGVATVRDEPRSADVGQVISMQRIERRLCELCAALPELWAVPALTVLASFAWWRGDGALTRIALDRARRIDPHYRLAELLERMVDLAIRPSHATA